MLIAKDTFIVSGVSPPPGFPAITLSTTKWLTYASTTSKVVASLEMRAVSTTAIRAICQKEREEEVDSGIRIDHKKGVGGIRTDHKVVSSLLHL